MALMNRPEQRGCVWANTTTNDARQRCWQMDTLLMSLCYYNFVFGDFATFEQSLGMLVQPSSLESQSSHLTAN